MKEVVKWIGVTIATLAVIVVVTLFATGNGWLAYQVFAPKYENTRRQVFENSRAFNQGMVQELQNMQFQYIQEKDPQAKKALASIILHRASGYNLNDPIVPEDLRSFIDGLKSKEGV